MPRQAKFGDAETQRMKDAYVLGDASLAKIAADFGVSVPTISKYLSLAGVTIRPRGRPRKKEHSGAPLVTTPVVAHPIEEEASLELPVTAETETVPETTPVFRFGD